MKKRLQGIMIGLLIAVMAANGVVFAKQISKNAELFYNGIKIYINGGEIVPKDANGNLVEPFIMNGTTYLPVRAVASALGQDVEWDGATQSVYIGKKDQNKPDNYLDRIQYVDYIVANSENTISKIDGTVTDYLGTYYKSGLLFKHESYKYSVGKIENDADDAKIIVNYPLNSQYLSFSGTIILPDIIDISGFKKIENATPDDQKVDVLFYGDEVLLKKSTVTKTMSMRFNFQVSGVNMLTIKIRHHISSFDDTYTALTDLALYK